MKDDIVVDKSPLIEQYLPPRPKPSPSSSVSGSQSTGQGDKLNRKQILIQQNIELRKKFETMVLQWQEILLDPVSEETLGEADIKGKFRISLHERKVFDISILKKFCSSTCLSASRWLEAQLTEEPIYLDNTDPTYLKMIRVSIVPLDMELADFQAQHDRRPVAEETKSSPVFSLPNQDLNNVTAQQPSSSRTSASTQSSSLEDEYVQSLLASVPATPSFIKIVEHDTIGEVPRDPLNMSNMDQDMEEIFGGNEQHHNYDAVDGYRVPAKTRRPEDVDTGTIEQGMSRVTLLDENQVTDGQTMRRSASSTSMDTRP
ncbi:hypothetical protein BGZ54_006608 [Gamsiella multidivaricata]|nr:hypothetical protein BGZ54_006608 [Gamsiella multidivaricata]